MAHMPGDDFDRWGCDFSDPQEVADCFAGYLMRLGVEDFVYQRLAGPNGVGSGSILSSSGTNNKCSLVSRLELKGVLAVALEAAGRLCEPVVWSSMILPIDETDRVFGDGLTVPVLEGLDGRMVAGVHLLAPTATAQIDMSDSWLWRVRVSVLQFHLRVRDALAGGAAESLGFQLTSRQRQCFSLVAQGKGTFEIGKILDISERTVVFHIENVKEKMGVSSRLQALTKLIFAGEIDPRNFN